MTSHLDYILERMSAGAVVVTATRGLARYLLHEFDRSQRQARNLAWPTPAVSSWTAWIESEFLRIAGSDPAMERLTLLDEAQELALWERVIARASQDRSADPLLQVAAAARTARDTRRLIKEWLLEPGEVESGAGEDTRAYLAWQTAFERLLASAHWLCEYELPVVLRRSAGSGAGAPAAQLVFAGFDLWPPARRQFLARLAAAGASIEVLEEPTGENGQWRVVACDDRRREFEAAAGWVRGCLEAGDPGPFGIIVDDLASERERIDAVFDRVLHAGQSLDQSDDRAKCYHISIGRPLSDYPLVATALTLLDFMAGARPIRDATRVLHSPFVAGGAQHSSRHALLDLALRRLGCREVDLNELLRLFRALPEHSSALESRLAEAVGFPLRSPQSPSAWAASFVAWLEFFGWPGDRPLNSTEFQTVHAWRELLSRFARLNVVAGEVDTSTALGTIRRMAGRRIFQGKEEPAPVQILGVMESSGMRFSGLWVTGMTDDAWPPPPKPNPFIPLAVQRRREIPGASAEVDLRRCEQITRRMLASAESVVISHARSQSGQPLRVSGLFSEYAGEVVASGDAGLTGCIRRGSAAPESIRDWQGPVFDGVHLQGGAGVLSDQSACPFRAFARHRLEVADAPRLEPGLDASARGSLAHECLAVVWREIGTSQRLADMTRDEVGEIADRAAERVLGRFYRRRGASLDSSVLELEKTRLAALVRSWLDVEREREPFRVVALEEGIETDFAGLEMALRIDRIDALADGSLVVIDYKTGANAKPAQWQGDRPEEPQLPLYLLALESAGKAVDGLVFAHLRIGVNRFAGLLGTTAFGRGPAVADDWPAQKGAWARVLNALADSYKQGEAGVDPRNTRVCEYCQIAPLCRLFEQPAARHGD